MRIILILLLLVVVGCNRKRYIVGILKKIECQTVFNVDKKIQYKHCRDLIYYECRINDNTLKIFKRLNNANKYCEKMRNKKGRRLK